MFIGEQAKFFCEVTEGGTQRITIWNIQLEGEGDTTQIVLDDPRFNLTGEFIEGDLGLRFNTNLTVLNATPELDNSILYCGTAINPILAFFILQVHGK